MARKRSEPEGLAEKHENIDESKNLPSDQSKSVLVDDGDDKTKEIVTFEKQEVAEADAAELVTVRGLMPEGTISFIEVNPKQPGGSVTIKGGATAQVAPTKRVQDAIWSGSLELQ